MVGFVVARVAAHVEVIAREKFDELEAEAVVPAHRLRARAER